MSEQTPPPEGQIHTPNPLEIFWETNRKGIIASVVILVLIVVGRWAWEEQARAERNATWGEFAQKTGLSQVFAPEDAKFPAQTMEMYKSLKLQPEQMQSLMQGLIGQVFDSQWNRIKGQLDSNLANLSTEDIQQVMKTYDGSPAGWWAEWVLACKYRALGESQKVESTLASLKEQAPQFGVFHKTTYPPVFVKGPDLKDLKGREKERAQEKILQAKDDSLASVLVEASKKEAVFRKEHMDLYKPSEPEGRTVIFDTSEGPIQVRLYEKSSPKTCAQFLKNVEEGLYKDLYFYEIWKKTEAMFQPNKSKLAFFGNPNAKEEDRTKWVEFKSEKTVPFESNRLSHFSYMLCAERQSDRIDSDTRLVYFTGNDCAESRDGDYVVFGRVINSEGKTLVDKIMSAPLESSKDEEAGKGKPSEPVLVRSVTVQK